MPTLHPALFEFLKAIRDHNSRKYFASIRPLYDDILANFQDFIQALIENIAQQDESLRGITAKQCIFRIYRDARMLKPGDYLYKYNRGAVISSYGKQSNHASLYLHLTPHNKSFVGGGVWRSDVGDLYKLRRYLTDHGQEYYDIVTDPAFKSVFGKVQGSSLKGLPHGFDQSDSFPELLKRKQFLIQRHFTDAEVLSEDFFGQILSTYSLAKPFFDFINTALDQ